MAENTECMFCRKSIPNEVFPEHLDTCSSQQSSKLLSHNEIKVIDTSGSMDNINILHKYNNTTSWITNNETDCSTAWFLLYTYGYQLTKIEIMFGSNGLNGCEMITLLQSNNLDTNTKMEQFMQYQCKLNDDRTAADPIQIIDVKHNTNSKHLRILRICFDGFILDPQKKAEYEYTTDFELCYIKFYGYLPPNTIISKNNELKYKWQYFKNDNHNLFEEKDATEVSTSSNIKLITTFPKIDPNWGSNIDIAYKNNDKTFSTSGLWHFNFGVDFYMIFDMSTSIKIDSVSVTFPKMEFVSVIRFFRVYTCDNYTIDNINENMEWVLINQILNIDRNKNIPLTIKLILKSKHKRYIKLTMDSRMGNIRIQRLKWNGFEILDKDDITHKINVYQCSSFEKGFEVKNLLSPTNEAWHSQPRISSVKEFVIFDCSRYEITKIIIMFENAKPDIMKLRMSQVGNAYSFNNKSIQIYDLAKHNSPQINVSFVDDNIYQNGFKRYLMFLFTGISYDYSDNGIGILQIRFYGKLSEQITDDSEQFDDVLDSYCNLIEQKIEYEIE
eukprot:35272_1